MTKIRDLTGDKFGRLTVVKRVKRPDHIKQGTYWLCKCSCGNEKIVWSWSLISGVTKSCGCLREENLEKQSKPNGEASFNRLVRKYKRDAKKRNISYNISDHDFKLLTKQNCHYCGAKPNQTIKSEYSTGDYIYNGLDRIDSSKGYSTDNCVPCCHQCNRAKSDLSVKEFENWIKRVSDRMRS